MRKINKIPSPAHLMFRNIGVESTNGQRGFLQADIYNGERFTAFSMVEICNHNSWTALNGKTLPEVEKICGELKFKLYLFKNSSELLRWMADGNTKD